jgi:aspartate racemase
VAADTPVIGIVGGVGPYAALDLARKILEETEATRDQDHLPVALLSLPASIADRSEFLLGHADANPGHAIAAVVEQLARAGCRIVGIPCNTAHAPPIFNVITRTLAARRCSIRLVNMVEEVVRSLASDHAGSVPVGVLSTTGTLRSGVYQAALAAAGMAVVTLDEATHAALVHEAVYSPRFGIKAHASPVTDEARERILEGIGRLAAARAEAVILACTELPLAVPERSVAGTTIVDATRVLARALVHAAAPDKLRRGRD